jgi:hypothetical protein
MSEINYVRGDATVPSVKGVKLIAHVCNDIGGWGKGFVLALSRRWPEPEKRPTGRWHRERAGNDFGLGATQLRPGRAPCVGGQHDRPAGTRTGSKGVPVRYEAIDTALALLADKARNSAHPSTCPASAAASRAASGHGSNR